ncbi:MAG TPA: hypothetical protein DCE18_09705 [Syntrophobacteraceae bacterium]|nr:hypothetical protein [Syntrophobacteraceae bacterium]
MAKYLRTKGVVRELLIKSAHPDDVHPDRQISSPPGRQIVNEFSFFRIDTVSVRGNIVINSYRRPRPPVKPQDQPDREAQSEDE